MSKLKDAMQGIGEPKLDRIYCRRCGQELEDPESKRLGIGPICADKERDDLHDENLLSDSEEDFDANS